MPYCARQVHDANVLLPLLMASAVAYGFTVLLMRRSILTEKIARQHQSIQLRRSLFLWLDARMHCTFPR
ncbi:hypothetical protein WM40_14300 [Robbsia andropogonis]|uniref:Uncharacterized protein n=1 Tax=Robbsia andropogonis TaxID=28092 RepID=A0A0F5K044_9BURK|nr:hypothetical protein WM40_14300 [Robbsia andropogonis]